MLAEKFLFDLIKTKNSVRQIELKLIELRMGATGLSAIRYDKDKVQTSASDRLPDDIAEVVEFEQRYDDAVKEYKRKLFIYFQVLESLDHFGQWLIDEHYMKDKALSILAKQCDKDVSTLSRLKKKYLKVARKIIDAMG